MNTEILIKAMKLSKQILATNDPSKFVRAQKVLDGMIAKYLCAELGITTDRLIQLISK